VEDLFDDVRKGIQAINGEIIGIGLRAADCISSLLEGAAPSAEQGSIVAEIAALSRKPEASAVLVKSSADAGSPPPAAASSTSGADGTALQVYRIEIKPIPGILHRGVKLESLFRELKAMGDYHASADAGAVPELGALDPSSVYLSWTITLSTSSDARTVRSVFMFVEDYADIRVEAIGPESKEGEFRVPKLGEVLVARGHLDEKTVDSIRNEQKPFGELALRSGKIKKHELDAALAEQQIVKSAAAEKEVRQESSTIRVRRDKLDFLVDSVGELVILQARLSQEAKKSGNPLFEGIAENLARLTATLRDSTMSVRMVPLEESFASFQRLVRDLSKQLGKELHLEIQGASTELDKNVIESLKDPLVHIIRNSADHGIEAAEARAAAGKPKAGTISVSARQMGSSVEIEVRDDGSGLDLGRIKAKAVERHLLDSGETDVDKIISVIMQPGFSTAERTTNLSGRGVGMDVVRTNIERLRGSISISSEAGKGTRIVLSIPLTLVIVDGLLVRVGGAEYVIALSLVQECVDHAEAIKGGSGSSGIIHLRGRTIPVIDLHDCLVGAPAGDIGESRLVIVTVDGADVALLVGSIAGKHQVVIKPFSASLKGIPVISGATILGDGSVALILNVNEVVKSNRSR